MHTNMNDGAMDWQQLVQEISEIEELISEARRPDDTQAIWCLHLLQSNLMLKRRQLKECLRR